jgi:hypothetical protein
MLSHTRSIRTCTYARFPRIVDGAAYAVARQGLERRSRPRRFSGEPTDNASKTPEEETES